MSIGSILGGGIRLVRTQPQVVAIWAALYLAVTVVSMIVMQPWMATMMVFQQQAAANAAAGIRTPPVFPVQWIGGLVLVELVLMVALVIGFAAVVRAVTRPSGDRFAYLRLGMDELRLIGLGFLFGFTAFCAEIAAILAILLISLVIGLAGGKAVVAGVVGVLVIALMCAAIYVEVRLSLAGALTVMRGRFVVRDAWRATQGQFWTLFGAYALLTIAFFGVTILTIALTNPQLLAAYSSLDPQAITAAGQEQMARQSTGLTAGIFVQLGFGAILGAVMGAVACGAVATAALELGTTAPVDDAAADFL